MADSKDYKFGVDMDISKALNSLHSLEGEVEKLTSKKVNNNDQLNQNEYNNVARNMSDAVDQVEAIQRQFEEAQHTASDLGKSIDFSSTLSQINDIEKELRRVMEKYSAMGTNLGINASRQYDESRYVPGQGRESYRGIGRNEGDEFREKYASRNSKVSRVQNEGERLMNNMKNTGYLNFADFKKLQATITHMENFRGHMTEKTSEDIRKREDELKKGDKRHQELTSQESLTADEQQELNQINAKNKALYEEIKVLEKHKRALERATNNLENIKTSMNEDLKDVKPERGTMQGMLYERAPSVAMGIVGITAGTVGNAYSQGGNIKERMLDDNLNIGTSTGNFDYHEVRKGAEALGMDKRVNMSGTEMLNAQAEYMDKAGLQSQADLESAGKNIGRFARGTGLSVEQSTDATSTLAQYTQGSNSSSIKMLQNAFAGGLKSSGMVGQNKQQLSALDNIVSTIGETTSLGVEDVQQLIGMQATLAATGEKSMQGEQGAQLMTDLNQGIQGSKGNSFAVSMLQMANPERYTGVGGYGQLMYDMNEGITGDAFKDSMASFMKQADMMGGNEEARVGNVGNMISTAFGVDLNNEQTRQFMELQKTGGLDKMSGDEIQAIVSGGEAELDKNAEDYSESSTATETKFANVLEKQYTAVNDFGSAIKGLATPVYEATGAMGVFVTALAVATAGILSATASMAGAGALRGFIGRNTRNRGIGGAGGNGDDRRGGLFSRLFGGGGGNNNPPSGPNPPNGNNPPGGVGGAGGAADDAVRGASTGSKVLKAVPFVGAAVGATVGGIDIYSQHKEDEAAGIEGKEHAENMGRATGGAVGGLAGGVAGGAATGALVGSVVPGVGTAIGGIAGGVAGGIAGTSLGGWIGEKVGGWFGSDEEKKEDVVKEKESEASEKDEQTTTDKKLTAEQLRAQNIAQDAQFVKDYQEAMRSGNINTQNYTPQDLSYEGPVLTSLSATTGATAASTMEYVAPTETYSSADEEKKKETSAEQKDEQSMIDSRKSVENKRAQNIAQDLLFVKQYRDAVNKAATINNIGGGGGRVPASDDGGVSDTEGDSDLPQEGEDTAGPPKEGEGSGATAIDDTTKKPVDHPLGGKDTVAARGASPKAVASALNITVNVKHDGKVATVQDVGNATQQVSAFVNNALKAVLPNGNQQRLG